MNTDDSTHESTVSLLRMIPFIPGLSPGVAGVVINVPKWSLGTEISRPPLASHELVKELNKQTVWESKKRIVWLMRFDRMAIQKCGDVSSSAEKESVASFLKRYLECEKYFLDSASAELNEWETEIHFSLFRIASMEEGSLHDLESQSFLTSTTTSLRFSGDFSDRYWICYFLDSQTQQADIPGGVTLGKRLLPSEDCGIRDDRDLGLMAAPHYNLDASERLYRRQETSTARSWQQRRVLELLIYSKMLEELRASASGILHSVKRLALRSHNDKYFESNSNSFRAVIQEANRLQELGEKEDYASIVRE